jgi:hypothetical protein
LLNKLYGCGQLGGAGLGVRFLYDDGGNVEIEFPGEVAKGLMKSDDISLGYAIQGLMHSSLKLLQFFDVVCCIGGVPVGMLRIQSRQLPADCLYLFNGMGDAHPNMRVIFFMVTFDQRDALAGINYLQRRQLIDHFIHKAFHAGAIDNEYLSAGECF